MTPSIESKNATFTLGYVCYLFGKARKGESRITCSVMANHYTPIFDLCGCIINAKIQVSRWNSNLYGLFEITRGRNGSKIRIRSVIGFDSRFGSGPFETRSELCCNLIGITCMAGGPRPLPGRSPTESSSSPSSSASSTSKPGYRVAGTSAGNLASLALIAERWRLDNDMVEEHTRHVE
jgi:hypothetical protein